MNQDLSQQEQDVKESKVEVDSPWFKLKLEDIDWKVILVVAMILCTIVYLVKG